MGSRRVGHDLAIEQQQQLIKKKILKKQRELLRIRYQQLNTIHNVF